MPDADPRIFGIRHHGPGTARALVRALKAYAPDCVLVEGPPEGQAALALAADEAMVPPVALLAWADDEPRRAAFYPFAEFSPEWQALRYAGAAGVPARFADLPLTHAFALDRADEEKPEPADALRRDPLAELARAAGHGDDGEQWWDAAFEARRGHDEDADGAFEVFDAILEAMTALRENRPPDNEREARREASMRGAIRQARKNGFARVAFVCGAWHGPALRTMPSAKDDAALLKGLPKAKVSATWVPWTHGRLAREGGYGAGVASPGWYDHLWRSRDRVAERWMARVAGLLRGRDLDCSPAHVIEATRLAEALAALRGKTLVGLAELDEAAASVMFDDADAGLKLIRAELTVGRAMGTVPATAPTVPLAGDVRARAKTLRLKFDAEAKELDLDLRKENDLERSTLFHRLALLDAPWATPARSATSDRGTFREAWTLAWKPELELALIEAGRWGNTLDAAASARAADDAAKLDALPALAALLARALLADLPAAAGEAAKQLQKRAASSGDAPALLDAIPPLAGTLRYGDVRKSAAEAADLRPLVAQLVTRASVGLPGAARGVNDDLAAELLPKLVSAAAAVPLVGDPSTTSEWTEGVRRLADLDDAHRLLVGRATRLLLDGGELDARDVAARLSRALSRAQAASDAAQWLEGFLGGSGALLVHDATLFGLIDAWLSGLNGDAFQEMLPLLRRTFSTFAPGERRVLGERAKTDATPKATADVGDIDLSSPRVRAGLPLIARILGITLKEAT